jgi:hypothetical protein
MPSVSNDTVGCLISSAGSGAIWTNDTNAKAPDGSYATCSLGPGVDSRPLGMNNCSMNVPAGATITGFAPFVLGHCSGSAGAATVTECRVFMDDGTSGSNLASGEGMPATDGLVGYGGPADLCGVSPVHATEPNVNGFNFNFFFVFHGAGGFGSTASVDRIGITAHYTTAGGGTGSSTAALMMHL